MVQLRRRLYRRGSSFETTVPMPILFEIDPKQGYDVLFNFDTTTKRWYITFQQRKKKKGERK